MDELTENAEEPDEGEKPEVQKLGKLQYKVIEMTPHWFPSNLLFLLAFIYIK